MIFSTTWQHCCRWPHRPCPFCLSCRRSKPKEPPALALLSNLTISTPACHRGDAWDPGNTPRLLYDDSFLTVILTERITAVCSYFRAPTTDCTSLYSAFRRISFHCMHLQRSFILKDIFLNQCEVIKAEVKSPRSCFVFPLSFWETSEPRDAEWHNLKKMIPLRHCYSALRRANTLLVKQWR